MVVVLADLAFDHSHFICAELLQSLTGTSFPTCPFGALGKEVLSRRTGRAYQARTSRAGGFIE
jgi:hypothetical protein